MIIDHLPEWNEALAADASARVARNALAGADVDQVTLDRARLVDPVTEIKIDDWKVADQKRSGRCWIFAGLNSLRGSVMRRTGIKDFEFSQAWVHFHDKLEKANYFLAAMAELAGRDLEDRTVTHLLANPVEDGGQWNMFVAVVRKYGLVPQYAMPETWSSEHTDHLNRDLNAILRKGALRIREAARSGAGDAAADTDAAVSRVREETLRDVYRVLVIHLGTPPERFDWHYREKPAPGAAGDSDARGAFHRGGVLSPRQFAERFLPDDLGDYVCLVNDPRNEYGRTFGVEYLGNVVGAPPVTYLNVSAEVLKAAARAAVEDGQSVWFGCDSLRFSDANHGVWADRLHDLAGLYGVELDTTKEERLRTGESMMVHAMVLTGYDAGSEATPAKWRVENSWGPDKADEGYWTLVDDWFDPYVFEVAVPRRFIPAELLDALAGEPIMLPAWDPMGALA